MRFSASLFAIFSKSSLIIYLYFLYLYFLISDFFFAEMLIPVRFPCFRYFDACFWQPRFQCFLDDVFYSSSSCSFSRSQLHYRQNIHVNFRLLLHRSPDDRISFESRSAAIVTISFWGLEACFLIINNFGENHVCCDAVCQTPGGFGICYSKTI